MGAALDVGVTHWDTALAYGAGRSEILCGKFIKGKREEVYLATKGVPGVHPGSIVDSLRTSLRNLGTDHVDLYYLHWPLRGVDMRPYMELLEAEREAGTIGAIGVSNFSVQEMVQVQEVGTIDVHQLCYNLFWRAAEDDLIPYCTRNGIAVASYSSIAQGILTGKFPRRPALPAGDARSGTVFFREEVWPHLWEATEELRSVASDLGCAVHHLAIQWIAQRGGIASILVGGRNGRQVRENAAALECRVPPEAMARVTEVADRVRKHLPDEGNIFGYYP